MLTPRTTVVLTLAALVTAAQTDTAAQNVDTDGRVVERFEFESYRDIASLAESLDYTEAAWSAGIREVPRLFLTDVPPRWRDQTSQEVSVQVKKQLFFRLLGPLALRANELILRDRARATPLVSRIVTGAAIDPDEREWLTRLAVRYKVIANDDVPLSPGALDDLLNYRVHAVPISLVLSQAAEESGWGTSRFAAEGNALFGQWSWDANAIRPQQQRAGLGNYGIAAFDTPLESIASYMLNLNTHPAYEELRERRAEMFHDGVPVNGWQLAETLTRYSERGSEYVDSLHTIMRVNHLAPADDAYLGDGPIILLVPIGPGAE